MTEHASLSDETLVQRIEQQDQAALAILYERYGTPVYSLAYQILQNPGMAEEVTQDTFLKVWQRSSRWDSNKGRFSSWLLTVTRYTAIDHLRREQRQAAPNSTPLDDAPPLESDTGLPDDPLLHDGRLLRSLLAHLPEEQAQVIILGFFQGMTHQEMAERLELPLGTVKTRVRLGLQKLRGLWLEATRQRRPLSAREDQSK